MNAWELRGLRKSWRRWPWSTPQPAVDGVDLVVAAGERLALVGESGSGKTTLARAGMGLVARDGGTIHVLGEDASRWGASAWAAARRRVQLLVQDPRATIHPRFPLGLQLAESARLHRPELDPRREAARALAEVGLAGREGALLRELSGGERRRAGIARVLLARPALVIADEPTAGLDAGMRAEILELLDRSLGPDCAIVVITHDLPAVTWMCDRAVVMAGGRLVDSFRPDELGAGAPRHPVAAGLLAAAGMAA